MVNSLTESGVNYQSLNTEDEVFDPQRNVRHRLLWIFENDFVQYDLGLMDENVWQAKLNGMALVYNFCFARPVYDARRNSSDTRFITLIEEFPDNCAE